MTHINMTATATATLGITQPNFTLETMSRRAFDIHLASAYRGQDIPAPFRDDAFSMTLSEPYEAVEYLNAPQGLIVLAHREDGQVDGIHPSCLSHHIESPRNIIEPFGGPAFGYSNHWMTRRSQGGLVLGAFGKMIEQGDPQAPYIEPENSTTYFDLGFFATPKGLIVALYNDDDTVHVIDQFEEAVFVG